MHEVERNRDAGNAVRGEPLFREPDVRMEADASGLELRIEAADAALDGGVLEPQAEVAEAQRQEALVGETSPSLFFDCAAFAGFIVCFRAHRQQGYRICSKATASAAGRAAAGGRRTPR